VTLIVQLAALPAVFLFWIGWLHFTGRRRGVRIALGFFALLYTVGIWRIVTADADGARLRVLLLPYESVVAGLLGLAYAYGWASSNSVVKIAGRIALTAAVLLIASVALGR
jgi:hypothetical protein